MTKPPAESDAPAPVPSSAQPMRPPSKPCTMKAFPTSSEDDAPVSTLNVPEAEPPADEVYAIDVHGSELTAPV